MVGTPPDAFASGHFAHLRADPSATPRNATKRSNLRLPRNRRPAMAQSRNSIEDIWGARTPFAGRNQWPERVDSRVSEAPGRWVQSACVLCSNGCGLDIGLKDGRIVGVR